MVQTDVGQVENLALADPTAPRFVWWEGQLRPTPEGLASLPTFTLLSPLGKARVVIAQYELGSSFERGRVRGEAGRLRKTQLLPLAILYIAGRVKGRKRVDVVPRSSAVLCRPPCQTHSPYRGVWRRLDSQPIHRTVGYGGYSIRNPFTVPWGMEVTRFATHSPYRGVWRRQIRAGLGAVGIKKGMPDYEESVEQFIRRNLGAEVFERLIEPFCSGVYAGDPSKLGMKVRITPRVGRHRGGNGEQQADAHTSMRGGVWAGWACRVHIAQPWGRRMEVSVCTDSW